MAKLLYILLNIFSHFNQVMRQKKTKKKNPNKLNNNKQTKKREEILTDKGYNIILLTQSAHFICLPAHTKKIN